jgi:aldehyde oxidase
MKSSSFQDPHKFPDIPETFMSALEDFPIETPQGIQMFQVGG